MDKIKAKVDNLVHHNKDTSTTHTGTSHTGTTHTGTTHTGTTHAGAGYGDPTGPHSSHAANKVDPRVDSDQLGGYGNTHSTGTYGSDPTGPHDSRMGNKVDPRVDSDRPGNLGNHATGHAGNTHGLAGSTGYGNPGPAPGTAGPHGSDMMNKVDPTVDSDLDGSKTFGANRTLR